MPHTIDEHPMTVGELPAWPSAGPEEHRLVADVLDSGRWTSATGTYVRGFEEAFAAYHEADHAVAIANGTVALVAALAALDLPAGSRVVVPSYTFFATAAAPLVLGLVPVFCDVTADRTTLDPDHLAALVDEATSAVVPVHLAGVPASMDAVTDVAGRHGIRVVEDAAQAAGVRYRGRPVPVGDIATFSFQASKNLAAGEGGALVTRSGALAERLYSLVNVGRVPGGGWYEHRSFGLNLRLTELQAAVLTAQLARHPELQERRRTGAELLHSLLTGTAGLDLPPVTLGDGTTHGHHLFVMRVTGLASAGRDRLVALLRDRGLTGASAGYVPLHANEALLARRDEVCRTLGVPVPVDECPRTESVAGQTVWLPQPVLLADPATIERVAAVVRQCLAEVRREEGR